MFSKSITWYHVILTALVFLGVVCVFLFVFTYAPDNIKHMLRAEWINWDVDPTPRFQRAVSGLSSSYVDTTVAYSLYNLLSIALTLVIVYVINKLWPHKPSSKQWIHKPLTMSQLAFVTVIGLLLAFSIPQLLAYLLVGPLNTKLY